VRAYNSIDSKLPFSFLTCEISQEMDTFWPTIQVVLALGVKMPLVAVLAWMWKVALAHELLL